MKNIVLLFITLFTSISIHSQEIVSKTADDLLVEKLYLKNKKEVINYSKKQFDDVFMEFHIKKANNSLLLTQEEYYNYTTKIAAYSDRLAMLYPKEKEVAEENKKMWLSLRYKDYLESKKNVKKQ